MFLAIVAFLFTCTVFAVPPPPANVAEHIRTQNELFKWVREKVADPSVYKVTNHPILTITLKAKKNDPSAVKTIRCPYGTIGTAFTVTDDGYAITAAHVVDGSDGSEKCLADVQKQFVKDKLDVKAFDWKFTYEYAVINGVGKKFEAKLIASLPTDEDDLALIRIADGKGEFTALQISSASYLSDEMIAVIGSPIGISDIVVFGKIARHELHKDKLLVIAPIYPGNSGGPVMTLHDRKIVGMVDIVLIARGSIAEIGGLIPAEKIRVFLEKELPGRKF